MKILLLLTALSLHATTVYLDSDALSTTNDSGYATVDLLHPAPMAGSSWISYGSTGIPSVTFTIQFILSGLSTGGGFEVRAKEFASVVLNGHTLDAATKKDSFAFAQLDPYLIDNGENTLSFDVSRGRGLDFAGTVETQATPEPATLAFIGCGLLTLAARRRRK
jgi:hypothetical protein